jgi:hypothetical protein
VTILQGPHQGAQKSITTGTEAAISDSKVSLSASTSHGSRLWQTAQRGTPSPAGRSRFFLPQFGQVTIDAGTMLLERFLCFR